MATENEKDSPTIVVDEDHPEQEKYELLKEKLRYKQAKRENARKIDHKQVRLNIQADALPTKTFFIMNALAAVIAAYGLLADSAAVVIGAMLVAMMLGPISGVALSFIDSRWILFRTAMSTLLMGVAMIFAIGVVIGFIHHDMPMTSEILSDTTHDDRPDDCTRRWCGRCICFGITSTVCCGGWCRCSNGFGTATCCQWDFNCAFSLGKRR